MLDLKDKLVLVTGAARGIGRAVAFEYASHGAQVILLDIISDKLAATAEDMRKAGYTVHPFECDLAKDFTPLATQIKNDIGVPDILHNNAVSAPQGSPENIDIEIVRRALDVSVLGYLRIMNGFLQEMIERKSGWIVNTSSPNGITPQPQWAALGLPYNICKAANISQSQSMAAGLKKHNIGVTLIFPGAVITEAIHNFQGAPTDHAKEALEHFLKVGMKPEDAARDFVQGVREGKFMVTNYKNFDNILVEFAKNGLDPNADYSAVF